MPLSAADLAQSYGWALSMLKSDKSLWNLFQSAVKGQWTADKFVAQLRNISWYKTNAASVRQYQALKATDPASLAQRRAALSAQIGDAAGQMGASMTAAQRARIVENALMFNWNDAQVRDSLAAYTRAVHGVYGGAAATDADEIRQAAWRNGIQLSGSSVQNYVQAIAAGNMTADSVKTLMRNQAKTLAPGYANELDSGMDLYDIANPYLQSKAKLLEMNPADVDLFDPDVRSALSGRGADGKPATMSLSDFETRIRKSDAWLKTQGAQDQAMSYGRQVLRDWGFVA